MKIQNTVRRYKMSKEADAKEALKYAEGIIEELIKHLEKSNLTDEDMQVLENLKRKLKSKERKEIK